MRCERVTLEPRAQCTNDATCVIRATRRTGATASLRVCETCAPDFTATGVWAVALRLLANGRTAPATTERRR